ncbi:MAG: MBL fold metallo-hydrolase [Bacteroidota bacterium]
MKLSVYTLPYNPFQENTYLVADEQHNCVIIDPGCYTSEEKSHLKSIITKLGLKVVALLNTHCHIDHVLGNAFVQREYGVEFYMHRDELPTLNAVPNYAHLYGFEGYELSPHPDHFLEDGQEISFGAIDFRVIFGPGHAPGHIAFYNAENNILLGGDILFKGSFGRVDLPGGDMETLKKTIHERIFTLPSETTVYPGHGPETTIAEEKTSNYILSF